VTDVIRQNAKFLSFAHGNPNYRTEVGVMDPLHFFYVLRELSARLTAALRASVQKDKFGLFLRPMPVYFTLTLAKIHKQAFSHEIAKARTPLRPFPPLSDPHLPGPHLPSPHLPGPHLQD
jgi:hypothetical protein